MTIRVLMFLLAVVCLYSQTAQFPASLADDQDLLVAKDNASSTLSAGINSTTLTVTVADGTKFPQYSSILIDSEQMVICSIASNTLTLCTGSRGFGGTTPATHSSGATVRGVITAWHHNALRVEMQAVQDALGVNFDPSNFASAAHTHAAADVTTGTLIAERVGSGTATSGNICVATGVGLACAWGTAGVGEVNAEEADTTPFEGHLVVYGDANNEIRANPGGFRVVASGSGWFLTGGDGTLPSTVILPELTANGSNSVWHVGAASQTADTCYIWPAVNGASGEVLQDSGTTAAIDPDGAGGLSSRACRILVWDSVTGGAGAPTDAKYWVSEPNGTLTDEVNLGALNDNNIVAVDITAGVATPRAATAADVVSTFDGGSCVGYLKNDGTCSTSSGGLGYALQFGYANTSASPADNTTYYVGCRPNTTWTTVVDSVRCYIPKAGAVKAVYLTTRATAGTSEQFTISFRINNTSDTTITSTATVDAAGGPGNNYVSNTGLNIAVAQGDYYEIKAVTPTWATNPTNWFTWGVVYVE